VDPRDHREYRGYLVSPGQAPTTINRRLIAMRRFFQWAERERMIVDCPFQILETILVKQQKNTAPRWLDRKEQLALLRAVREKGSKRDLGIIRALLGTGLRISEPAALKVSDLEISERRGSLQVRAGKGDKARPIPLDDNTRQALCSYLDE
jgi:integrase/recombinase XerD